MLPSAGLNGYYDEAHDPKEANALRRRLLECKGQQNGIGFHGSTGGGRGDERRIERARLLKLMAARRRCPAGPMGGEFKNTILLSLDAEAVDRK